MISRGFIFLLLTEVLSFRRHFYFDHGLSSKKIKKNGSKEQELPTKDENYSSTYSQSKKTLIANEGEKSFSDSLLNAAGLLNTIKIKQNGGSLIEKYKQMHTDTTDSDPVQLRMASNFTIPSTQWEAEELCESIWEECESKENKLDGWNSPNADVLSIDRVITSETAHKCPQFADIFDTMIWDGIVGPQFHAGLQAREYHCFQGIGVLPECCATGQCEEGFKCAGVPTTAGFPVGSDGGQKKADDAAKLAGISTSMSEIQCRAECDKLEQARTSIGSKTGCVAYDRTKDGQCTLYSSVSSENNKPYADGAKPLKGYTKNDASGICLAVVSLENHFSSPAGMPMLISAESFKYECVSALFKQPPIPQPISSEGLCSAYWHGCHVKQLIKDGKIGHKPKKPDIKQETAQADASTAEGEAQGEAQLLMQKGMDQAMKKANLAIEKTTAGGFIIKNSLSLRLNRSKSWEYDNPGVQNVISLRHKFPDRKGRNGKNRRFAPLILARLYYQKEFANSASFIVDKKSFLTREAAQSAFEMMEPPVQPEEEWVSKDTAINQCPNIKRLIHFGHLTDSDIPTTGLTRSDYIHGCTGFVDEITRLQQEVEESLTTNSGFLYGTKLEEKNTKLNNEVLPDFLILPKPEEECYVYWQKCFNGVKEAAKKGELKTKESGEPLNVQDDTTTDSSGVPPENSQTVAATVAVGFLSKSSSSSGISTTADVLPPPPPSLNKTFVEPSLPISAVLEVEHCQSLQYHMLESDRIQLEQKANQGFGLARSEFFRMCSNFMYDLPANTPVNKPLVDITYDDWKNCKYCQSECHDLTANCHYETSYHHDCEACSNCEFQCENWIGINDLEKCQFCQSEPTNGCQSCAERHESCTRDNDQVVKCFEKCDLTACPMPNNGLGGPSAHSSAVGVSSGATRCENCLRQCDDSWCIEDCYDICGFEKKLSQEKYDKNLVEKVIEENDLKKGTQIGKGGPEPGAGGESEKQEAAEAEAAVEPELVIHHKKDLEKDLVALKTIVETQNKLKKQQETQEPVTDETVISEGTAEENAAMDADVANDVPPSELVPAMENSGELGEILAEPKHVILEKMVYYGPGLCLAAHPGPKKPPVEGEDPAKAKEAGKIDSYITHSGMKKFEDCQTLCLKDTHCTYVGITHGEEGFKCDLFHMGFCELENDSIDIDQEEIQQASQGAAATTASGTDPVAPTTVPESSKKPGPTQVTFQKEPTNLPLCKEGSWYNPETKQCKTNKCQCLHGIPVSGKDCREDGAMICEREACAMGFGYAPWTEQCVSQKMMMRQHGEGQCKEGKSLQVYASNDGQGEIGSEQCEEVCLLEDNCRFASFYKSLDPSHNPRTLCERYEGDGECDLVLPEPTEDEKKALKKGEEQKNKIKANDAAKVKGNEKANAPVAPPITITEADALAKLPKPKSEFFTFKKLPAIYGRFTSPVKGKTEAKIVETAPNVFTLADCMQVCDKSAVGGGSLTPCQAIGYVEEESECTLYAEPYDNGYNSTTKLAEGDNEKVRIVSNRIRQDGDVSPPVEEPEGDGV